MYGNILESQCVWLASVYGTEVLFVYIVVHNRSLEFMAHRKAAVLDGVLLYCHSLSAKFSPYCALLLSAMFFSTLKDTSAIFSNLYFLLSARFESRGWDSAVERKTCICPPDGWYEGCVWKPSIDLERQHPAPAGPAGALLPSTPSLRWGAGPGHGHLLPGPR